MKKLLLVFAAATSGLSTFAQSGPGGPGDPGHESPCQVVAEPYVDCRRGTTWLNATPGFNSYQWSPAGSVSNPNIANPMATGPGSYTVTACTTIGPELVYNGDFSLGNTGFASGLIHAAFYNPGYYFIGSDWFSPAYNPGTYPDHTATTDNMFMSVDGGAAGTLLWSQTISVSAFTNYQFQFFHTMCNVNGPIFEVRYTGDVTGTTTVYLQPSNPGVGNPWEWVPDPGVLVDCWNSQNNNTVLIEVINNQGDPYGDDFAFDDVSFRECCCSSYIVNIPSGPSMGPNLFTNGDFSAGGTGFFTAYNYAPFYNPGYVFAGAGWFNTPYDPNFPDHTLTSDNMFLSVDGATSPTILWQETVPVTPGGTYRYSFWATRADYMQPKWEIHFVGNVTGDVIVSIQGGIPYTGAWQWDEYMVACWNAGQNTSVTVYMIDQQLSAAGDDYGMDDFSFRQCCKPDECCQGGPNPNREMSPEVSTGFNVFPNPSNGAFTIQYPTAVDNAQVEIINVLGERVDVFTFSGTTYSYAPAAKLAPGIYIVRITNCGEQKDVELVIEE